MIQYNTYTNIYRHKSLIICLYCTNTRYIFNMTFLDGRYWVRYLRARLNDTTYIEILSESVHTLATLVNRYILYLFIRLMAFVRCVVAVRNA